MWQTITLTKNNGNGGKMNVHQMTLRYDAEKKSFGLTLNQYLNEAIEKGGYFYFGLMKETESGVVAMILQNRQTPNNVRMQGSTHMGKKENYSYNYCIKSRETVEQIYDALGINKDKNSFIRLTIGDNMSRNDTCMLFEVEIPANMLSK